MPASSRPPASRPTARWCTPRVPFFEPADPARPRAAATVLVRITNHQQDAAEPPLLHRAVAELTTAADNPAPTRVTDYNEGDFHGRIERTLRSLPAGAP